MTEGSQISARRESDKCHRNEEGHRLHAEQECGNCTESRKETSLHFVRFNFVEYISLFFVSFFFLATRETISLVYYFKSQKKGVTARIVTRCSVRLRADTAEKIHAVCSHMLAAKMKYTVDVLSRRRSPPFAYTHEHTCTQ